jgi:predicted dehydrogenase
MLRIGIVGIGGAHTVGSKRGRSFIRVFNAMPGVQVTAVCDVLEDGLAEVEQQFGIKKLYTNYAGMLNDDIDAVVVASPAPMHAEHCIAALNAGKHVLSEVPACYALDECRPLVNAVRESGKKYMFAENVCYFAYVEAWKQMIKQGRIGKLIYAEGEYIHDCRSLMVNPDGRKTWRADMPPIQYLTHTLGPIVQMMEAHPVSVVGMHTGCNVAPEIGVIDMEVALIRMSNGAVVKQLCGFSVAREPSHSWLSIYGTKGVLEGKRWDQDQIKGYHEDIPNLHGMVTYPLNNDHTNVPPEARLGGHGTSEYFMLKDFVDCIVNDTKPAIDIYDAMDFTVPGLCAHLSAENSGNPVDIPNFR